MDKNDCLREALVFLDSVRASYPSGIPKGAVASVQPTAEKQLQLLHFVGTVTPAGKVVLDAALSQGLKIDSARATISALAEKDAASSAKLQQFVEAKLAQHPARVIVFMGRALADVLFDPAKREAVDEDGFLAYNGMRALLTDDLGEVADNAQAKKRFWNELKKARTLFAAQEQK